LSEINSAGATSVNIVVEVSLGRPAGAMRTVVILAPRWETKS
jgi:hypothetical protein